MIKKEILFPIAIIALSIIFSIIVFAVFLSNGKSKFWISKKMRIGAVILSLSSFSVQQACVTCYEPAMDDMYEFERDSTGTLSINLSDSSRVVGTIYSRMSSVYSFSITSSELDNDTLDLGEILPADGSYDEPTEDVYFDIDTSLNEGVYKLNIFKVKSDIQNMNEPYYIENINIIKDDKH